MDMSRHLGIEREPDDTSLVSEPATLDHVSIVDSSIKGIRAEKGQAKAESAPSSMAVSIAGFSTACSKDALASSAKAVREALSTE
jgi:hypothetical protein